MAGTRRDGRSRWSGVPRQTHYVRSALIIDLDGVLRHWNPEHVTDIERRHGLPIGSLFRTAFAEERLRAAITGQVTDAQWRAGVAAALEREHGGPAAQRAVADWSALPGEVNTPVLHIVRGQRRRGRTVVLASNATDRLSADLGRLGLDRDFDAVFNSSAIGYAKPDQRVFAHIVDTLGVQPSHCLFVDDTAVNVAASSQAGLSSHRYRSPKDLITFLDAV
jgi:putative hydrolase of the HAD superfamily